jgi:hypothetical protein
MAIFGGSAFFIGMKWRAVLQRSEASKAASKGVNYSVAPGRSGTIPYPYSFPYVSISLEHGVHDTDVFTDVTQAVAYDEIPRIKTTFHEHMAESREVVADVIHRL